MANKRKKRRKKKSGGRTLLLVLGFLLVLILLLVLAVFILFHYYYGRSNYVEDTKVTIDADFEKHMQEADETYEEATLAASEEQELYQKYLEAWRRAMQGKNRGDSGSDGTGEAGTEEDDTGEAEVPVSEADNGLSERMDNTYNILLIGTDKRPEWNFYGNSDVMVLVTINESKNTIYLTSFMRDLYANIPGVGVRKLNSAFAMGAGPLLMQTLRTNYGVKIDNYASVNFDSMAKIIDMFGGVEVEVNAAEAAYAHLPSNGTGVLTHLNGTQAVSYARIRRVGNADYERTSRQREVLTSLFSHIRASNVSDFLGLANSILPMTTHNIDMNTLTWIVTKAPTWINYNPVQLRVPFDGYYTSSNEILIPDFDYTLSTLLGTIY